MVTEIECQAETFEWYCSCTMKTLNISETHLIGVVIHLKAFEKNILYPQTGSTKTLKWGSLAMVEEEKNVNGLRTEFVHNSQSTRLELGSSSPIDYSVSECMN